MYNYQSRLSRRLFLAGGIAAAGSLFVGRLAASAQEMLGVDTACGGAAALNKSTIDSTYYYPLCDAAALGAWLQHVATALPGGITLELSIVTAPEEWADRCGQQNGKVAMVKASVSTDPPEAAAAALQKLATCPIAYRCLRQTVTKRAAFEQLSATNGARPPRARHPQRRYSETIFSNAKVSDIFTELRGHVKMAPAANTIFMFRIATGASASTRLEGLLSTEWSEPDADAVNLSWHKNCLALLRPFSAIS